MSSRKRSSTSLPTSALSANWHKFLTRATRPPPASADMVALHDHVRKVCGDLLEDAEEDGVFPDSMLLAQFHSIPPAGVQFNFSVPEVVCDDRRHEVHEGSGQLASFVRNNPRASFFRTAVAQGRGILWIVSSFDKLSVAPIHGLATVTTRLPTHLVPGVHSGPTPLRTWTYEMRDPSLGVGRDSTIHPPVWPIDLPTEILDIFGEFGPRYLAALQGLARLGEVVLCVPNLFEMDNPHRYGGGGFFVFDEPCSPDVLMGLHVLSHRLAMVFGDSFQFVQQIAKRESDRRLSEGFAMLHHSVGNALNKSISSSDSAAHVGRVLALERLALEAALLYADENARANLYLFGQCGFEQESFAATLANVLGTIMHPLNIEVRDGLDTAEFDALALSLMVECCRNVIKHRHQKATIAERVVIERDPDDWSRFRLYLETMASASNMLNLDASLSATVPGRSKQNWILYLARRVAIGGADPKDHKRCLVSWSFLLPGESTTTSYGDIWKITKLSLEDDDPRPLTMILGICGLIPHRSQRR